jgi:hypothetical protein
MEISQRDLHHPAQGCAARATLGPDLNPSGNSEGVGSSAGGAQREITRAARDGRNPDRVDRMGEQEPSVVAEATTLGWLILSRCDRSLRAARSNRSTTLTGLRGRWTSQRRRNPVCQRKIKRRRLCTAITFRILASGSIEHGRSSGSPLTPDHGLFG